MRHHDSNRNYNIWWGPPKKFSAHIEERKISWLELFYDLVYVIVISRVTHLLAENHSWMGILDYAYLFTMTFWGWYNGSQYHDLHGSPGIRTRFMTLWQMMAVGALAVILEGPAEEVTFRATIGFLVMQLFITYLWWSVGIYDKHHRKLNVPYTVSFLAASALLVLSFFVPGPYKRLIYMIALPLNFFPFIQTSLRLRKGVDEFSMSASMTERLGLLTIIVFGEVILGVINGMTHLQELTAFTWFCFGMGILITFALWWIFFALIADRACKKGMLEGILVALIYIPALASLGIVGAAFPELLESIHRKEGPVHAHQLLYGVGIAVFLVCVAVISRFMVYPPDYEKAKRPVQILLAVTGGLNLLFILLFPVTGLVPYLLVTLCSLLIIIVVSTRSWFRIELNRTSAGKQQE